MHFIEKEREGKGKRGEARTGDQSGGRGDRREEEQRGVRKGEGREFWTHLHAQTISRLWLINTLFKNIHLTLNK